MSEKHNGWTNYETWIINLWMDNDEGSSVYWREQAENAILDGESVSKLADQLKEEHEEALPKLEGFAADLMHAALGEANWFEIAEHLIANAKAEAVSPFVSTRGAD